MQLQSTMYYTQSNQAMAYNPHGNRLSRRRISNTGSELLSPDENQRLFSLYGDNVVSICAGVVQLLYSDNKNKPQWRLFNKGIIGFMKDHTKRVYALRLYCLVKNDCIFEQILYRNFMPIRDNQRPNLLCFEGPDKMFALNFSSVREADTLYIHMQKRREKEQQTASSEREAKVVTRPKQPEPVRSVPAVTTMGAVPFANNQQQKFNLFQSTPKEDKKKDKKKDNKKVKLRKEDISLPSNFQHTAHLGWNQSTGYEQHVPDTNAVDDSVRDVIRAAGINPDDLKHDDLAYAKKFIENYKDPPRDLLNAWGDNNSPANSTTSVSSKSQSVNSPRGNYHGAVPPPPPVRRDYQPSGPNMGSIGSDHSINSSPRYYTSDNSSPKTSVAPVVKRPVFNPPPPPAKLNRPPPPPPMTMKIDRSAPPPPAPFSNGGYNLRQGSNNAAPPPPITPKHGNNTATSSAPPPPPLPPPGALKLAQTPSTNNTGNYEQQQTAPKPPPMQEPRGGLLAEIQAGRSLKPVEQASPTDNNPRDGLLAQIQRGTNLKHVDSDSIQQNRKSATTVSDAGGIAGALARALEERRKNMLVSDSESDGDNNDDEWDTD